MKSSTEKTEFVLEYEFNAPQEQVFNAFGDAEALNAWWGPVGTNNSVISLDFRKDGIFHYKMESHGKISYGRFLFFTIQPHSLLEFSNGFTDEHANIVKAPFDISLPKEIFYRLVFVPKGNKTVVTLTGYPLHGTEEETKGFQSIRSSMEEGFGATFDQLANYLIKQKSL